jgi:ribonuclease Y
LFNFWSIILLIIFCVFAGAYGGFTFGMSRKKKIDRITLNSVEEEAKHIIEDAKREAEVKKKDALLQAKDEIIKSRTDADRELSDQRRNIAKQERKLQEKEEFLEKRSNQLDSRHENINNKLKLAQEKLNEAEIFKNKQLSLLEEISELSQEQAKEKLLKKIDLELDREKSLKIKDFEQRLKNESDKKSREILSTVMQRIAADHVAETTISVVMLPSDDMKGRIIGREGRNIRTIEMLTGVDLIIDDTPEAITLSTFDPVRREIARVALEKLILDGRIHPTKIEEMIEKAKQEVNNTIKSEGERAVIEAKIAPLHPDLVELLGRLHYRMSYGQNVLEHSLEVSQICAMICFEIGIDPIFARRAGLLHDIGKALSHTIEGSHVEIGADVARKYKEDPAIIHAIEAHHGDVEPNSLVACIVQAADAISAARPGARRENLENHIKRLEKLEELASSFDGVEHCFAIQAGREIRIIVNPDTIKDEAMALLARNICKKVQDDLKFPGQIKVNIIRESRFMDYAR